MRRLFWIITISLTALVVGFFLGHWVLPEENPEGVTLKKITAQNTNFQFIKPLLGVELTTKTGFLKSLQPMVKEIKKSFEQKKDNQDIQSVSYYYFDLATSHWAGFAENDQFDPASLYKVPIMMAYLKRAESNPELLNTKITFKTNSSSSSFLESDLANSTLKSGETYTVDQLIATMIENSDNVAKTLLLNLIQEKPNLIDWENLNDIFSYLGINISNNRDKDLIISARTYSIFLRLLYNGNYLDFDSSEKALKLLSQSKFKEGIAAGVPKDIVVANKFGIYDIDENGKLVTPELHDCGIVYHPEKPYLICVMTKGNDLEKLKGVIKDLSKITYDFVEKNL